MAYADAATAVIANRIVSHGERSSAQFQSTCLDASSIEKGVATDNRNGVCGKCVTYIDLSTSSTL